jgi:ribosomal protein L12E/L44/L45/RPP1/RPP2
VSNPLAKLAGKAVGVDLDEVDIPALIGRLDTLEESLEAIRSAAERSATATERSAAALERLAALL